MADTISFWEVADSEVNNVTPAPSDGRIWITKREENGKYYANLYVDFGTKRYLLKPPYNLDDLIRIVENPETHEQSTDSILLNQIYKRLNILERFAGHFKIIREWEKNEEILHIYGGGEEIEANDQPITRLMLKDLITDGVDANPGSINVDGTPVYVSDFLPSEELVGYIVLPAESGDNND